MTYQRSKGISDPKFEKGPNCDGCPYRKRSRGFVPPVGGIARHMINADPTEEWHKPIIVSLDYSGIKDMLIVGEASGAQEIITGLPFMGGAGYELDRVFSRSGNGMTKHDFTVTNVVKCRPIQYSKEGPFISPYTKDHKNRTPEPEMQRECYSRYLKHELAAFKDKGKFILALGDIPLQNLTDNKGITKHRGTLQKDRVHGIPLMAAFHPAYLMRKYAAMNITARDFARIPLYLKGDIVTPPEHIDVRPVILYKDRRFQIAPDGAIPSIDIETRSKIDPKGALDPYNGEIGVVGVACNTTEADVYEWTGHSELMLRDYINNLDAIIGQNMYGFDAYWFIVKGMKPPEKMYDTMTMHHLANSDGAHDLWTVHSEFAPIPKPSWKFKHHYQESKSTVCGRDVINTLEAYNGLEDYLRGEGQWGTYVNDIMPLQHTLLQLRHRGIRVNREKMYAYHKGMEKQILKREKLLRGAIGGGFNWRSPIQLANLLYDKMGFPEKTIRGTPKRTTNKDALEELWEENPSSKILRVIMELRKLAKLDSTYFQLATDPEARAHPQLLAHGTGTGRLACKEPTIHNIPDGPARAVFIPDEEDFRFVYGDYSQIEFLTQAWYAREWDILKRGLEGYDFHRMVSSMFFGIDYEKEAFWKSSDGKAMRHKAKFIDFGLNYGRGAASIARANNISVEEVKSLMARYFASMPGMQQLRNQSIANCRNLGYDDTVFNRRRWLRASEVTKIFNFKSQSTAAHITNRALVRIHKNEGALYMLTPLTVHDSITVQCHKDDVDLVAQSIQQQMSYPVPEIPMPGVPQGISFPVEIKTGENWGTYDEKTNKGGLQVWSPRQ